MSLIKKILWFTSCIAVVPVILLLFITFKQAPVVDPSDTPDAPLEVSESEQAAPSEPDELVASDEEMSTEEEDFTNFQYDFDSVVEAQELFTFVFPDSESQPDRFNLRIVYDSTNTDFFSLDLEDYYDDDGQTSVFDILLAVAADENLDVKYNNHELYGVFLETINNIPDKTVNPDFYWEFIVDGEVPQVGINDFYPEKGQSILLFNYKWIPKNSYEYITFIEFSKQNPDDISYEDFIKQYDVFYTQYLLENGITIDDLSFTDYITRISEGEIERPNFK